MNDEQKLAWAERHRVEPPPFLRERVARQRSELAAAPAPRAACCQSAAAHAADHSADECRQQGSTVQLVLMSDQSRCRGGSVWFHLLSAALIETPEPLVVLSLGLPQRVVIAVNSYPSRRLQPPVPPPRLA